MFVDIFNYKDLIKTYTINTHCISTAETEAYNKHIKEFPNQPYTHMRVRFETGEVQTTIFDDL